MRNASAIRFASRLTITLMIGWVTIGCVHDPHGYRSLSIEESLAVIRSRHSNVESMSAECVVRIDDGAGRRGTLDGAISAVPDAFRVQAWRGPRTILDLIANTDGVWIDGEAAADIGADTPTSPSEFPTGFSRALWNAMSGATLLDKHGQWSSRGDSQFIWHNPNGEWGPTTVVVDRSILEPIQWIVNLSNGHEIDIRLGGYREIDAGRQWPTHVDLRVQDQRIDVRLRDVVLNDLTPPGAFRPSRGAVRLDR